MDQRPEFELAQGNRHDPLHYLPPELTLMICQKLEIRNLLLCLIVSKDWKSLLESFRALWMSLDTTNIHSAIPTKVLRAFLKRSNFTLHRAIIDLRSKADMRRLEYINETSKNLKELMIDGRIWIDDMQVSLFSSFKEIEKLHVSQNVSMTSSVAQAVLKSCRVTLVEVKIWCISGSEHRFADYQWPKLDALKSISLQASGHGKLDITGFLKATPNVTTVILDRFDIMPKNILDLRSWLYLERLDLVGAELSNFPLLPQTLRHLNLDGNRKLSLTADSERELVSLPVLESFSCHYTSNKSQSLIAITQSYIQANSLKSLDISGRGRVVNTFRKIS